MSLLFKAVLVGGLGAAAITVGLDLFERQLDFGLPWGVRFAVLFSSGRA